MVKRYKNDNRLIKNYCINLRKRFISHRNRVGAEKRKKDQFIGEAIVFRTVHSSSSRSQKVSSSEGSVIEKKRNNKETQPKQNYVRHLVKGILCPNCYWATAHYCTHCIFHFIFFFSCFLFCLLYKQKHDFSLSIAIRTLSHRRFCYLNQLRNTVISRVRPTDRGMFKPEKKKKNRGREGKILSSKRSIKDGLGEGKQRGHETVD